MHAGVNDSSDGVLVYLCQPAVMLKPYLVRIRNMAKVILSAAMPR